MKRILILLLALLTLSALSACGKERARTPAVGEKSPYAESDAVTDVRMIADPAVCSVRNPTLHLTLINSSDRTYTYGAQFDLEILQDGVWMQLDPAPSENEYGWPAVEYLLNGNSSQTFNEGLEVYGNRFEPGTYRIIKTFLTDGSDAGFACAIFELE